MRMANGDDTFSLTSFQVSPAGHRQRAALGASVPNVGSCRLAGKMPTPHNDLGGGRLGMHANTGTAPVTLRRASESSPTAQPSQENA